MRTNKMIKRLSILDMAPIDFDITGKQALENVIHLAKAADQLGYERYWVTEHHNIPTVASTSPEMLIGQIAVHTKRIRIGSGGVMLTNHSPLKIAEHFKLLEAFYPGRVDLGIGRAPGTDGLAALALRRSQQPYRADDLEALLHELQSYDGQKVMNDNPFTHIKAMPIDVSLPPILILGSSMYSAHLAAKEGLQYSFAYHFNPNGAKEAISTYRQQYREIHGQEAPPVILGVSVMSGESEGEVLYQKKLLTLKHLQNIGVLQKVDWSKAEETSISSQMQSLADPYLATLVMGTHYKLKEKLDVLANELQVEELMLTSTQRGFDTRLKMYEKLADLYQLDSKILTKI